MKKPNLGIMIVIADKKEKNMKQDGMVDDMEKSEMSGEMNNLVNLPEGALADTQEGEMVEFSGMGKVYMKDGQRCLEVSEVEGMPVGGSEVQDEKEDVGNRLKSAIKNFSKEQNGSY